MQLVGSKFVICNETLNNWNTKFLPLFENNDARRIIGTKICYYSLLEEADNIIELPNYKYSDFKFKNAIINSGYKFYSKL